MVLSDERGTGVCSSVTHEVLNTERCFFAQWCRALKGLAVNGHVKGHAVGDADTGVNPQSRHPGRRGAAVVRAQKRTY